jgi:hypothetical protein
LSLAPLSCFYYLELPKATNSLEALSNSTLIVFYYALPTFFIGLGVSFSTPLKRARILDNGIKPSKALAKKLVSVLFTTKEYP